MTAGENADVEMTEDTQAKQETMPKFIPGPNCIDISPKQDGGVFKEIIKEGIADEKPQAGDKVSVHYVGTLLDGTKFDSSRDRGKTFEFNLSKGSVIKGWDIGVATMNKGETALLTCAPEYAYGAAGSPPTIPPNATLQFEVELLDWKGEDLSKSKDGGIIRRIITPGEGYSTPNEGSSVEVHLTGKHEGRVFDDRGVTFTLGEGFDHNICEGLERALEKFKKGEKSLLALKSQYAFGPEGNKQFNIPPNTDIDYEVQLKSFEKAKAEWELEPGEKLEQAKLAKEKGGKYFKEGKYQQAIKQYNRIISLLDATVGFSDTQIEEQNQLKLAAHLNLAMCYLKVNNHLEARESCTKALELDPNNVKGLFRRGQAYLGLVEPELASQDFEEVLRLEPGNKAASNQLIVCKCMIKEQKEKEKRLYANMFEKFAQIDNKKEEAERMKQPDVLETLGEWGDDDKKRSVHDDDSVPDIVMLDGSGDVTGKFDASVCPPEDHH